MTTTTQFTFAVSGMAMSVIDGSEIYSNPVNYDGGSQGAKDAMDGLRSAEVRRVGKGRSYRVTTTREGAETIEDYCRTVGESFLGGTDDDPETRADGRALIIVADRIRALLKDAS